ncbi:sulfite exporter TauE/SafE family protein [Bacteroidaceae bacterium HV4-6-C5C]|jgi:Predicted permeases|nr:sulfite exporter TauE/SafE family protein [Bacteroidaceae bacterium HV4-6-C5C]
MDISIFTLILFVGAICAGLLGSLTGLGGGVVIIPLLTLGFGVDMRYAVGSALVTSIATSSGAAAAYIREGITNTRIGMFLEIATTTGAVAGALVAMYLPTNIIALIFGGILIFSALMTVRKKNTTLDPSAPSDKLANVLKLNGSYPTKDGVVKYNVHGVAGGYSLMTLAGILSGILGIGSGALKVLAMDAVMKIPFKVSTTTSNFMVGVTAAASAVIYLQRGYIDPGLAMPIVPGVLIGAFFGSKILMKVKVGTLRMIFSVLITLLALQMIYNALTGKI